MKQWLAIPVGKSQEHHRCDVPELNAVAIIERIFPSPTTILKPGVLDTGDSDLRVSGREEH